MAAKFTKSLSSPWYPRTSSDSDDFILAEAFSIPGSSIDVPLNRPAPPPEVKEIIKMVVKTTKSKACLPPSRPKSSPTPADKIRSFGLPPPPMPGPKGPPGVF